MTRYHPFLVALHWLTALMILVALLVGGPGLAALENTHPDKLFGLAGHMIWGGVIGVLMMVRLMMRLLAQSPPAPSGAKSLKTGAKLSHWGLYALVFAMVGSGLATAVQADLFAIVFGGSGASLPEDFSAFAARVAHGVIATALLGFIGLHLMGWAYHQFVLRDGLIRRMWFGKRHPAQAAE